MTDYVRNLLQVYDQSTAHEVEAGLDWYPSTNHFCASLARRYRVPAERVIGALAVLSPKINWTFACKDIIKILDARAAGGSGLDVKTTAMPANRTKAVRILDGQPGQVTGAKVECFADNLRGACQSVTVDVWAWRAAIGDYTVKARWLTYHQSARVQDAYREAADRVGLPPREFQAIVWLTVQRLSKVKSEQLSLF